jgi:glycosyltransferase involved in cell wall biosynthesis
LRLGQAFGSDYEPIFTKRHDETQMTAAVTAIVTCMTDAERPFLRETLLSVQNQTMACETIVVAKESNAWIDDIAAAFPQFRIMRRPPGFAGAARNTGIAAAKTEFVAFLDGDDVWLPTKTKRQVDFLRNGCRDFVGVDHVLMTEEGKPFAYAFARHFPMPSAWMVRRETMLRYPFDPNWALGEDWQWWESTWSAVRKFRLPEPLIKYRVRRQSASTTIPSMRLKLALAKPSGLPMVRLPLLAATYALYRLYRRPDYVVPKALQGQKAAVIESRS